VPAPVPTTGASRHWSSATFHSLIRPAFEKLNRRSFKSPLTTGGGCLNPSYARRAMSSGDP
jgi:hypothetical protein